jgi:aquaporin Z
MNKYVAEFVGTFALIFAGTGAIIVNDFSEGMITHVGIALTFGLVVMVMIYAVGDISGAHFNPAVTLGFWLAGRLPGRTIWPYIFSQVTGGLLASLWLKLLFPDHVSLGATIPAILPYRAFLFEMIITFMLMFVIINVAVGAKEVGIMAGAAIGGTVALAALFAGPATGASMNPARSLAPALISGNITNLWLYLIAPFAGAAIAIFCWRWLRHQQLDWISPEMQAEHASLENNL